MSDPAASPSTDTRSEATAARRVACSMLAAVLDKNQTLDQVLESDPHVRDLSPRDRAFSRMMVATALRCLGQIDDVIRRASEKADDPSPRLLHHILRLGAVQILFMDVPAYAAVDTSVRLAEAQGLARQKGFVNAVLRRLEREGRIWVQQQDAIALNIPHWLMESWRRDYGAEAAGMIAQASLAEAPLDITIADPARADSWAAALQASILPTGTLRRATGGVISDLPGFRDGAWWVQDAAAALPVLLFGDVAGKRMIDLCAAPGGKTAQLVARGAYVTAVDRSSGRLKRLNENLRRLGLADGVEKVAADACNWMPAEKADGVLVDAPCTATGTIRRHPDALHLKSDADVIALAKVQKAMLMQASGFVKMGGVLIYCTCSLQKEEGESQIDGFLRTPAGATWRRVPVMLAEIGGMEGALTAAGDVRVLPFHMAALGGMDGFFISRLQKIA